MIVVSKLGLNVARETSRTPDYVINNIPKGAQSDSGKAREPVRLKSYNDSDAGFEFTTIVGEDRFKSVDRHKNLNDQPLDNLHCG